ncbi:MAG: TonB-dependent receptor, partial [Acidobacteriaceae bacterium]|nr:TonB-dependent receptor [Acidobacteriaceae bacterium]
NLVPGNYLVSASATGFKTVLRSDIIVDVGSEVVVDLELPVGQINEKVTVTGQAPDIQQSSSSLDYTVNSTTVRELPLNGRDWTQLSLLQPGVSATDQSNLAVNNQRANRGLGTQLSIGGNRPQQNNYRLDGVSINDYSNGGPGSILGVVLGVEAVQEFSVVTDNAPASYGKTGGGVINAVTRSGTDQLHGSVYWFLRNSDLDARNFFDPSTIPPFRRNQFGADAGGPIVKNRTFFFADYEGIRQSLGTTQVDTVPSPNARNGILANGTTVAVNPRVVPYLALYPLPNAGITGDFGVFDLPTTTITRENFVTGRLDHRISDKDSLFSTYMWDDGHLTSPDAFNNVLLGTLSNRQAAVLEETHIFGPSFLNTFRLGYSRVASEAPKSISAINSAAADMSLGFVPNAPVGLINVTGLTNFPGGFGAVGEYDFHYNSYQLYDDLSLTKARHAMTFGVALENIRDNQLGKSNPIGQFIFGSLSAFLAGNSTTFNAPVGSGITPRDMRQLITGVYFMDDWRIANNLTVNLGVRYEAATVPSEATGKLSHLPSLTATAPLLGSPYFANNTKLDFEPRVGFAWDPFKNNKTSVRGAFGIFDNLPLPYLFELSSILSAPYFENGTINNPGVAAFPNGAYSLLTPATFRYAYIQPNPPRSYIMQWNFNIQRQLAENTVVMVDYTGSRGVHLPYFINDFNGVLPTPTPAGYLWPSKVGTKLNPAVGQISGTLWDSDSEYEAFQAQLNRRFSKGLQGTVSYTFSRAIDSGSSSLASDTFTNSAQRLWYDPSEGRGLSDFDIRHLLSVNFIYELPGMTGGATALHWITNGWQLGGLLRASSGTPFTPQIGGDPLGMSNASTFDRPDVVDSSSCAGSLVNPGNPRHYINTQCFVVPSPITLLGNAGRNILIGPGLLDLDTSLFKNFQIQEWLRAQFRAEFFNVLNHPNFAPPTSNNSLFGANGAPVATAGLITSTLTSSRQIQFGLKLIW